MSDEFGGEAAEMRSVPGAVATGSHHYDLDQVECATRRYRSRY